MIKVLVKRFYDKKIYSKDDVKVFVRSGDITEEDYFKVTGSYFNEKEEATI